MENKEVSRNGLLKARIFFDANEYIRLIKEKSPEDLRLEPDGKLIFNVRAGEMIFSDTKEKLNLTPEEMKGYVIDLETEIRRILSKQT